MTNIVTKLIAAATLVALSACTVANPETDELAQLGDFSLGHNVAITTKARKAGPSRTASAEEWEIAMEQAIDKRFSRYQGDKLYHLGISLDGYALAVPGIPVVLAPRSIMAIKVTVWDDAAGVKLNDTPKSLTIFEQIDGGTIIGSGYANTREEQIDNLSANMAKAVERFLAANSEWFGGTTTPEAIAAAEQDVLQIPEGVAVPDEDVPVN